MQQNQQLKVCIAGATGWAGRAVVRGVVEAPDLSLVGAVSRSGVGGDLGDALGQDPLGVPIYATVREAVDGIDVLIDSVDTTKLGSAAVFRRRDRSLLGGSAGWAFDIATLWACFRAFGTAPPVARHRPDATAGCRMNARAVASGCLVVDGGRGGRCRRQLGRDGDGGRGGGWWVGHGGDAVDRRQLPGLAPRSSHRSRRTARPGRHRRQTGRVWDDGLLAAYARHVPPGATAVSAGARIPQGRPRRRRGHPEAPSLPRPAPGDAAPAGAVRPGPPGALAPDAQTVKDGSSGADRLSTAPAMAGEALILASSARRRTAR
jgi:hypothetical protein